jgi:hypothetical protein
MKEILKFIFKWIVIIGITYLFLSFLNYSFNLKEWNGFSRFILGAESVFFLITLIDEI